MSKRKRSLLAKTTVSIALLGSCGAATLAVIHPAAAASFITAVQSMVTCSTTSTGCVVGTNTNSGAGVVGTSNTGIGVNGTGTQGPGMYGSSTSSDGVVGVSTSAYGVLGYSSKFYGVEGQSNSSTGSGVYGVSPAYGVTGTSSTSTGTGVNGITSMGVATLGSASGSGVGVWGESQKGLGVYALSSSGTALSAYSQSGLGANIESNGAYSAITAYNSVAGLAHPAVYGKNSAAGYGAHFDGGYGGVWGSAPGATNGYPLVATDQNQNPNTVFDVNGQGDIYYTGYLYQVARAVDGTTVHAYGTQTTLPTVEDTGTAQLVGGSATVKLDSTFSRTIDAASSYRVFITANGDTRGLFVTSKTAGAFIVHENQGGRSTVSFDYRIVATALGHAGQRMAVTSRAALMPQFSALPPVTPMAQPTRPLHLSAFPARP